MALTAAQKTDLYRFFALAFEAAPGVTFMNQLDAAINSPMTLKQVVNEFIKKPEFTSIYFNFLTNQEFAQKFVDRNVASTATTAAKDEAVAEITALLNAGHSRGDVIVDVFGALAATPFTDTKWGDTAKLLSNQVAYAQYFTETLGGGAEAVPNVTALRNVIANVTHTTDVTPAAIEAALNPPVNQTFVLTNNPDAFTGGAGSDTFIATEATLSSADALAGSTGNDTLKYTSSGNAAVSEAGFTATDVETVQVTSDAVGGTTFDVTGVTGLGTIVNTNSSNNLTFDGLGKIAVLDVKGISAGSTVVNYRSTVISGTADTQVIKLSDNVTNAGGAVGSITVNGVETIAITSAVDKSILTGVASDKLSTITVDGAASLNLGTVNFQGSTSGTATVAGNTLNASAFTGNLTVALGNNSGTTDVAVTGGSGNDRVDFGASYDKLDAFTGGTGTDTVAMTNAVATAIVATDSGTVSGVEILGVTTAGTGTVSLANFAGVSRVNFEAGQAGAVTVSKAPSAVTVGVFKVDTVAHNLTVNLAADAAADAVTIELHDIGTADAAGTLSTATSTTEFETVNLVVRDDTTVDGVGKVTVANINTVDGTTATLQFATAMTIDTNATLVITAATTNVATGNTAGDVNGLSSLDASASTGNINAIELDYQAVTTGGNTAGATIKLGAGNDSMVAGNGADTITLGAGKDVIYYGTVAQSDRDMDTITDFVSGTDILNIASSSAGSLVNWGATNGTFTSAAQFAGNRANFGEAQGALAGKSSGTATVNAVFQIDTNTLWVDANGDGTLDNSDFRIKLNGVTALTTADLSIVAQTGNSVTLTAKSQTVNLTSTTPGATTNFDDTVSTTVAFLNGSTITGGGQLIADTLALTTAGTVNINDGGTGGTVTEIENLTLAAGTNAISFTGTSGIKNVTGNTGSDSVTTANLTAGGAINLGDGTDAVTYGAALAATTFDLGAGDDTFTSTVGNTIANTIAGGAGTDTLSLKNSDNISTATITGFENLTLADNAAVTMTNAQYAALTAGTVTAGATETVTLTNAATVTAVTTIEKYTFGNFTNTFTSAVTADQVITGGTGADSFTFTAGFTKDDVVVGGTGTDTLTIAQNLGGFNFNEVANNLQGIENLVLSVSQTAGTSITLDEGLLTFDASANSDAMTLVGTLAGMTSIKLGSALVGNDTITTVVANTAVQTIDLGPGADTITNLNTGNVALTINSGTGNLTIADVKAVGTGVLTLQFGSLAGSTTAVSVAATTANFAVGTVFDFATDVTSIVIGAANGTNGVAGALGQLFIEQTGGNTIITFDADGNRLFSTGDVQITIVGNLVSGGITGGNFVIGTSANP